MDRPIQTLSKSYTGSVQGVKVRSAQLDDFEAILDIDRNLYQVSHSVNSPYLDKNLILKKTY